MKLYCIGKSKEEKGSQLEWLTQAILHNQGFENIICNAIGSGGNEIDVSAQLRQSLMAEIMEIPVICECKAHKEPINMDDWQKFLGKRFIKARDNSQTIGIMISLSGAKSTVLSDYTNLKSKNDKSVLLYSGEILAELVQQIFRVEKENEIRLLVEDKLNTPVSEVSLICYKEHFIWYVALGEEKFTLYSHTVIWSNDEIDQIIGLLMKDKIVGNRGFVNFWEHDRQQMELQIIQMQLINILSISGPQTVKNVIETINNLPTTIVPISEIMLKKSIGQFPFITETDDKIAMKPDDEMDFIKFYRFVLVGGCPTDFLKSDYYQSHINADLLRRILEIQANLNISERFYPQILFLLKNSPIALLYAIFPDEKIVKIRRPEVTVQQISEIDEIYNNIFIDGISRGFMTDYEDYVDKLWELHTHVQGIVEVGFSSMLTIKTSDGEQFKYPSSKKYSIMNIPETKQKARCHII